MSSSRPLVIVAAIVVVFGFVLFSRRGASEVTTAPSTVTETMPETMPEAMPETVVDEPVTETTAAPLPQVAAYVVTRTGALLVDDEGAESVTAAGVLMPILAETEDGYRALTTCNDPVTVSSAEVDVGRVPVGGVTFGDSVFVIDPGHGLPDHGAVGPEGLSETVLNLDVSHRIVELLQAAQDIDWATGAVTAGTAYPAVASAIMTRSPEGPNGGDYELGLTFRATVANSAQATALVSIHHNSSPETTLDRPGSEAFVPADDPESSRLGGLIVEELRASLGRFDADWVGSTSRGLVTRIDPDGSDFYTLLDRAEVPAVISEAAYISNPTEEALAMTDEYRQAHAEGVYRALVRFVTTDDFPIPAPEPIVWETDTETLTMSGCEVPSP